MFRAGCKTLLTLLPGSDSDCELGSKLMSQLHYTGVVKKKVNIDFEPFRPINTSLYLRDNKFHTEVCH